MSATDWPEMTRKIAILLAPLTPDERVAVAQEAVKLAEKCQTCGSPAPHLHPAVQFEGEVEICKDEFHKRRTPQNQFPAGASPQVRGSPEAGGGTLASGLLNQEDL